MASTQSFNKRKQKMADKEKKNKKLNKCEKY